MKKWLSLVIVGLVGMILMVAACAPPPEEKAVTPEEFYRGKSLRYICWAAPGGGHDLYARLFIPYLAKELGLEQFLIDNIGGGTGIVGGNIVYNNVPRDGSVFGSGSGSSMIAYEVIVGVPDGAQWKSGSEFSIIAIIGTPPPLIVATPELPYNSLQELKGVKGLKSGATDPITTHAYQGAVFAECMGLDDYKVVVGYGGSPIILTAVFNGEVDLAFMAAETALSNIKAGMVKVIGVLDNKRHPVYPNAQAVSEVALPGTEKWMEMARALAGTTRMFAGPPGMPEDRLEFIRAAFTRVLQNPDFQQEIERRDLYIEGAAVGKEAETVRDIVMALSPTEKDEFRDIVFKYQK
ncbi:Bug family tripartite tricarboxylate transporter substrate binding protein [Chloroflexota bacterium]